jgi:DUF2911 family protein
MKTHKLYVASLATWGALLAPFSARAQLDLPRPSPQAKVFQRVGLTDISIDYSSPGVKSRKIWGGLVPFDKMWRAGANAATKITLSGAANVCGKEVPAGTYSLFFIPAQKDWAAILNKNADSTVEAYNQSLDVARCTVKPSSISMRERMIYVFSNTTDDATSLDLEWEKLKVSIPIKVDTQTQSLANIKNATEGAWRIFANSARYLLDTKKDYDEGLVHRKIAPAQRGLVQRLDQSLPPRREGQLQGGLCARRQGEPARQAVASFLRRSRRQEGARRVEEQEVARHRPSSAR